MSKPRILRCSCGKKFANQSSLNMHMTATKHSPVPGNEQKTQVKPERKPGLLKRILKKIFRKK